MTVEIRVDSVRPTPVLLFILVSIAVGWTGATASNRTTPVGPARIIVEQADKIAPGGYLLLDVIVPYYQQCTATVRRALYDAKGVRHVLPELRLPQSEIGVQHSASRFALPDGFAPGPGEYRSQVAYGCNWFQRWIWPISVPERRVSFVVNAPPVGPMMPGELE